MLDKIRDFLQEHRFGDLWVCTGSTNAWGFAMLGELAPDRAVTILMASDPDLVHSQSPEDQRRRARDFLNRRDVRVMTWPKPGSRNPERQRMHIKAYIADPTGDEPVALVGSANLTRAGLMTNQEAMVTASPADTTELVRRVEVMLRESPTERNNEVCVALGRKPPKTTTRSRTHRYRVKRR